MELKDLNIFVSVAKTGSVTKTAGLLGYVQSNITARIQHLENHLGTTLFNRHSRGVSLTASGETLLHYADKILNLCGEAEQVLQDGKTPTGTLRIGAMETTTATRLPSILTKYHQLFPKVNISLTSGPTELLIESVLNYDIEGAFVAGPLEHSLLDISAIIEEELVLVSQSENMPLSSSSTEQQLTIVSFRNGCSYRKRLELYLDHLGIQSRKVIELGTLDGILGCVTAGLGVSLVPQKVIDQGKHPVYCHQIPPNFGKVPTVFIHRKNSFCSPALKRFIEVVRENSRVLL